MSLEIEHFFGSKYENIEDYRNGMAVVTNSEELMGAIDDSGNEIVECNYKIIYSFNKYGLAIAGHFNGKYGIINKKGDVLVPFEYESIYTEDDEAYYCAEKGSDEPYIFDTEDCHLITRGKAKKIDEYVYEFGGKIYDVKRRKFLELPFTMFNKYGNIYLGKISDSLMLYDQNLNYIDTINSCVKTEREGCNLILRTKGKIREWEDALINTETGEYIPSNKNIGYKVNYSAGVELYIHCLENNKKSTIFINNNNQLITLPDVHAECIWSSKEDSNRTVLYVEELRYIGIYAEDGTKIIPCEYYSITPAGNCYIVQTHDSKYGLIGLDGTMLMEPEYHNIVYLGENRYYVTDDNGKEFLVDEKGKLITDFSMPGVRIQGKEKTADSLEEINAWERKVISELQAKYLARIAEIEAQSSEEIERLKADYDEANEYLSGPSHTLSNN